MEFYWTEVYCLKIKFSIKSFVWLKSLVYLSQEGQFKKGRREWVIKEMVPNFIEEEPRVIERTFLKCKEEIFLIDRRVLIVLLRVLSKMNKYGR